MTRSTDQGLPGRVAGWWLQPARPGAQQLISPWEYRHLPLFGAMRLGGGAAALVAGAICLAYDARGRAAFFLALGALNLAGGLWYLRVARGR